MLNEFTESPGDAWHPQDNAIPIPVPQQKQKQHHSINGEFRGNNFGASHRICCRNELQGQRETEGHYCHCWQEYCPTFQDTWPKQNLSGVTNTRMPRTRQYSTGKAVQWDFHRAMTVYTAAEGVSRHQPVQRKCTRPSYLVHLAL